MLLAADVGATKTLVACYSVGASFNQPDMEQAFITSEYESLAEILAVVVSQYGRHIRYASIGIAGPVTNGVVQGTYLPWTVESENLRNAFGFDRVLITNDLLAAAYAIPSLKADSDLEPLIKGQTRLHAPVAIIAPGTGLGEAFAFWENCAFKPYPSEGGHADFAPTSKLERELLVYLEGLYEHVSYDRVCSGRGLQDIYGFIRSNGLAEEPDWLAKQLAATDDPTPLIIDCGMNQKVPICEWTLKTFISVLASEAGNMALRTLALGGVYIGGGIPPRVLPLMKDQGFRVKFSQKGRLATVLQQVPVFVITNPKTALHGAALYGMERMVF